MQNLRRTSAGLLLVLLVRLLTGWLLLWVALRAWKPLRRTLLRRCGWRFEGGSWKASNSCLQSLALASVS